MFDGVINVYKERGCTSHDVVARLRRILRQKKIGHAGTLDPEAEGVLPVCLGKATRLCDMLADHGKTYRAALLLGRETDTQDAWGNVIRERAVEGVVDEAAAREAVMGFVGEYAQIPPMYSARKVNGKKLYELAREGRVVERRPRRVFIHGIAIESVELPRVFMTVDCSKGTYIRTLCHDIGEKLGCGGCMEALVRTRVGRFALEDGLTLAEIEKLAGQGKLEERMASVEEMLGHHPAGVVKRDWDGLARNGNPLRAGQVRLGEWGGTPPTGAEDFPEQDARDGACFRIYDSEGAFMGIYQWEREKSRLKPQKMFFGGRQG